MKCSLSILAYVDLLIILALSLAVAPLVLLGIRPLQIAVGLLFLLFVPGYTLIAALFPRRRALDGIERVALSFGLSIAVVPLIGLILNYTPWGIRLYPILISVLLFIIIMAGVAWFRRQRLPAEERFQVRLRPLFSSLSGSLMPRGRWDRLLTILLLVAIVGAIGTLAYVIASPKIGERFTEFYILGLEGKAANYPQELPLGQEGKVIVGIVNREHEAIIYRLAIAIDGQGLKELGSFPLGHEEKWEKEISFIPTRAGLNQKVEFLLYQAESSKPYLGLHLWVNVREAP